MADTTASSSSAAAGMAAGGADPVTAIANAIGELSKLTNSILQPGILATKAYFQQLLNAQVVFQNPFAAQQEGQRKTNQILVYAGVAIIMLMILAILFKKTSR